MCRKMSALGTPLDALALDFLSFGFFPVVINNIWAWVAVMTAAVSFWRIRAVGPLASKSDDPDHKSSPLMVLPRPPQTTEEEEEAASEAASVSTPASSTTSLTKETSVAAAVDTTGGPTRGKFTVYYHEDESEEGEFDDEGGVGEVGKGGGGDDYWWDNWEKVMRMRIGDGDHMGWYRYQDLTVLDGNVVRLWDGCRDKSTISL